MTVVCWVSFHLFFSFFPFCFCVCVCVCISVCMCVRIWQFHVCRPMIMSSIQNQRLDMTIKYMNEINEKYIRIHSFKYPQCLFAILLSHRDRKPKYASKFWTKHGGNGKRWPLIPFPFLAPWPSRPPAIETPPRPVPARPLISWPKNASCPTPSKPRLSPAVTMSDDTPSALTPPLHCASILQPAAPPQVVAFES